MEKSGPESRLGLHQLTIKRVSMSMSSRSFTRSISFMTQEDKPTAATSNSPSTSAEATQCQGVTSGRSSLRTADSSGKILLESKLTIRPSRVDGTATHTCTQILISFSGMKLSNQSKSAGNTSQPLSGCTLRRQSGTRARTPCTLCTIYKHTISTDLITE